ncbi:hypothetical protein ACFL2C_01370 [Patescibacteria group bacterium]
MAETDEGGKDEVSKENRFTTKESLLELANDFEEKAGELPHPKDKEALVQASENIKSTIQGWEKARDEALDLGEFGLGDYDPSDIKYHWGVSTPGKPGVSPFITLQQFNQWVNTDADTRLTGEGMTAVIGLLGVDLTPAQLRQDLQSNTKPLDGGGTAVSVNYPLVGEGAEEGGVSLHLNKTSGTQNADSSNILIKISSEVAQEMLDWGIAKVDSPAPTQTTQPASENSVEDEFFF